MRHRRSANARLCRRPAPYRTTHAAAMTRRRLLRPSTENRVVSSCASLRYRFRPDSRSDHKTDGRFTRMQTGSARIKQTARRSTADDQPHYLALIKLADGIFDMLPQQTALFRRHMAVATALIEIGRNGGANDRFGRWGVGVRIAWQAGHPVTGMRSGARGGGAVHLRLIRGRLIGEGGRTQRACKRARHCQRDHAQPHVRPHPPFILFPS